MDEMPGTEETHDSLAPGAVDRSSPRRAWWQWMGAVTAFAVVAAVIGGILFKVPYVALVPGTARDTEPLVVVEGIESYPSDGELLLTTVRVRQRPNFWEYLWLQTDDDNDVVPEDLILGGRSPEENRDFNLALMSDSKAVAVAVALEQLGYDAIESDGAQIVELVPGSAAEAVVGLGDVVTAIDDEPVDSTTDLVEILGTRAPGDAVVLTLEVFDGDTGSWAESTVEVVLGAKDDDPDAAFLGVGPVDNMDIRTDFDFTIDIDSGSVGGPSAGLAFTLAVLDQLTAGELTGGATVAVTGTIGADGRVGSVGGVVQKTAAVRDLGADLFIIPASLPEAELSKVFERAGDNLKIVPVNDIEEALDALAELGGEVEAVEEFAASNLS